VSANGPLFIDINPRLVEPANAWLAGVDLVGALVDVATGGPARHATDGREGVATHQLLLAVLGAAQGRGRAGKLQPSSSMRRVGAGPTSQQ